MRRALQIVRGLSQSPRLGAPNGGGNRAKHVLYLGGGKVEPSHDSHQAEHEDDGFAALGHSGDLTSRLYSARRKPDLLKPVSALFSSE